MIAHMRSSPAATVNKTTHIILAFIWICCNMNLGCC